MTSKWPIWTAPGICLLLPNGLFIVRTGHVPVAVCQQAAVLNECQSIEYTIRCTTVRGSVLVHFKNPTRFLAPRDLDFQNRTQQLFYGHPLRRRSNTFVSWVLGLGARGRSNLWIPFADACVWFCLFRNLRPVLSAQMVNKCVDLAYLLVTAVFGLGFSTVSYKICSGRCGENKEVWFKKCL